jgi:hypothetical protein
MTGNWLKRVSIPADEMIDGAITINYCTVRQEMGAAQCDRLASWITAKSLLNLLDRFSDWDNLMDR